MWNRRDTFTDSTWTEFLDKAATDPRARYGEGLQDPNHSTQRVVNVMLRKSYSKPHTAPAPGLWLSAHSNLWLQDIVVLEGDALVLILNEKGEIIKHHCLGPTHSVKVVSFYDDRTYHSVVALRDGTMLYEVVRGPYKPEKRRFLKGFPEEGTPEGEELVKTWIKQYS